MTNVWTASPRKRFIAAAGILQSRSAAKDKLCLVLEIYLEIVSWVFHGAFGLRAPACFKYLCGVLPIYWQAREITRAVRQCDPDDEGIARELLQAIINCLTVFRKARYHTIRPRWSG